MSGARVTSYWTATLLWDVIVSLLLLAITVALVAAFQIEAFSGDDGLAAVFLLFVSLHIT